MLKKNFLIIIILTIIFTGIIFFIKMYFFSGVEKAIEEEYIDKSLYLNLESSKEEVVYNTQEGKIKEIVSTGFTSPVVKKNIINYKFFYIPKSIEQDVYPQTSAIKNIMSYNIFLNTINNLGIDFFKNKFDVRGKMKNGKVKLYGVLDINNSELIAVFIHELAHFIDIYYLNNDNEENFDNSNYFYDIAWESTKTIKSEMKGGDFVSGYSMTNKYEDFAESFTYYVLHNSDFVKKSEESDILKEKYNFFRQYLFINKEFELKKFGEGDKIKDYYRDITKIDINLEKFLQYLKNDI
ncbi:hypothetical protein EOM39_04160 [Candidatus Gracilibacteria bacterium]|nr:hypothetical protein [Candidatus Gracilibacteria bacterium]